MRLLPGGGRKGRVKAAPVVQVILTVKGGSRLYLDNSPVVGFVLIVPSPGFGLGRVLVTTGLKAAKGRPGSGKFVPGDHGWPSPVGGGMNATRLGGKGDTANLHAVDTGSRG